ncbi:MAG: hypothetical protein WCK42_08145 [Myxococcaceae bacterium]
MRLIWIILILSLSACSPCKKLAEKICDCEKTQSARNNCKKGLDIRKQHKAFSKAEDTARCEAALKNENCTCEAIRANQFEACGFTRQ